MFHYSIFKPSWLILLPSAVVLFMVLPYLLEHVSTELFCFEKLVEWFTNPHVYWWQPYIFSVQVRNPCMTKPSWSEGGRIYTLEKGMSTTTECFWYKRRKKNILGKTPNKSWVNNSMMEHNILKSCQPLYWQPFG